MIKLNIHEAKTHLSSYLEKIAKGEVVVLCKHNQPVAEIRAISEGEGKSKKKRPIGLDKGKIKIEDSFFEPLPDEIIKGFLNPL